VPLKALSSALCLTLCSALILFPARGPARTVTPELRAAAATKRRGTVKPTFQPVSVLFNTGEAAEPPSPVPAGFLGLSFETASLSQLAHYAGTGDLATLLRSLGPGVLRFGGVTADEQVAWTDASTPRPPWASSTIDPSDLEGLATLARSSGWRVLLTIGMAHYEPEAAAREAAAAKAALGSSLEAIELGNEPNSYARHAFRSEPWSFIQYESQVDAYRSAIEALAPGIPLAGPDVSGSAAFETWGLGEAIDLQPAILTGHHYPLGCSDANAPTITRLLSPHIRALAQRSLERYLSISRAAGIPFRLDEANTVSCGGTAGISNTFASSLWAVGYLLQTIDAGAAGINLQGNPTNCSGYTPLCAQTAASVAAGALTVQPEWYALLFTRALIGDLPIASTFHAGGHPNLQISALRAPTGALHVAIVDYEPPGALPVRVSLHVGRGYRRASLLSLLSPSPEALTGVTLGGRSVTPSGTWTPAPILPTRSNIRGVITTTVAPSTAVLVTIPPLHPTA
jgi:hypothetical protein